MRAGYKLTSFNITFLICVEVKTETKSSFKRKLQDLIVITREVHLLWHNHQHGNQVLRVQNKVLLLHDVSQTPGQQAPPKGRRRQCVVTRRRSRINTDDGNR